MNQNRCTDRAFHANTLSEKMTDQINQINMSQNRSPDGNFRASCDNCANSKVRCGKEQPCCARCFRLGMMCIYSPSQRSRRRPQRTLDHRHDPMVEIATSSAPTGYMTPRSLGSTVGIQDSLFDADMVIDPSTDFMKLLGESTSVGLFADVGRDHHSLSYHMDHSMADTSERTRSHKDESVMQSGVMTPNSNEQICRGDAGSPTRFDRDVRDRDGEQESCEEAVLQRLLELGTPPRCRGRSRSSRDLGRLLKTCRKALACAACVLDCNCTFDTSNALLVTILLLHTLAWYDVFLPEREVAQSQPATCVDSDDCCKFSNDCCHNSARFHESGMLGDVPGRDRGGSVSSDMPPAAAIVVPPILIGSYELDAESQERIICNIILGDLKKIESLAQTIFSKAGSASSRAPHNSRQGVDQTPKFMRCMLLQKHDVLWRRIERKLQISDT